MGIIDAMPPDEQEPPRKFYGLKPKEFERLNKVAGEPAQPDLRPDPGIVHTEKERIDLRDILHTAAHGAPLLGNNGPVNRENEVHGVLRENHAAANAAGLNTLAPKPKRRSRRTRDYWIVMIPVNGFFAFWAFGPWANPASFVYGIAGMALFTSGFTWVMFFIMEDY
jgi:hypothetical protein